MRQATLYVLLAMSLLMQGCCSVWTRGPQPVSVKSVPPGAKVRIGPHQGTAPYRVLLPRGTCYVITAELDGQTKTQKLRKNIERVYWANIVFFPGFVIDFATGKMFNYEPKVYTFDFTAQ